MSAYVAKPYVAGTPDAEVMGSTMIAFTENLEFDRISQLLEDHNLTTIDPDRWYPHQLWMDVLHDIERQLGGEATSAFVAFGRQVVETAAMPDAIQTIPDALNALHAIHHANLRNVPEEEGYALEVISDNEYIVYHNTPNPDDAIYGFLWGMAARFKRPGEMFVVEKIKNERPDSARSAFRVKWGKDI